MTWLASIPAVFNDLLYFGLQAFIAVTGMKLSIKRFAYHFADPYGNSQMLASILGENAMAVAMVLKGLSDMSLN
ncbi:MAG: hypothetical protein U5L96_05395 [Owenweeksia sp.]|nr:hypothetical protein [Owenweeksia sp.]